MNGTRAELAEQLEEARRELARYRRLLEEIGSRRLREAEELSNVVESLRRAKAELQAARDHLERRVEARTAAVMEVNQRLEQEIAERRKVETELLKSESRYRLLADNVTDMIWTMDLDMRQTYCSPSVERMRGFAVEEALAQSLDEILAPSSYELAVKILSLERMNRRNRAGASSRTWSLDLEVIRKDGSTVWTEMNIKPILQQGPDGDTVELLGVARDITQRRLDEERLKDSLREKEVLLREIHHRVKNNLQLMSSMLELQAQHLENMDLAGTVKQAQQRIWAMASAHETLYQSGNFNEISSRDYFNRLLEDLVSTGPAALGRIDFSGDFDDIPMNLDTAVNCGLILSEMIANCHKHAFPNMVAGAVAASLKVVDDNRIELVVRDNGVGLPEGTKLESLKTFGLNLVSMLVEELRGEISVKSAGGTEFRITFPKERACASNLTGGRR